MLKHWALEQAEREHSSELVGAGLGARVQPSGGLGVVQHLAMKQFGWGKGSCTLPKPPPSHEGSALN